MIDEYLEGEDWGEAPEAMAFEAAYGKIIEEILVLHTVLRDEGQPQKAKTASALRLYVRAPALVNVALNYKICAEHGLPLHPAVYYELAEARRYDIGHPLAQIELANRLYRSSIDLARSAYRLDSGFPFLAAEFNASLPEEILRFVYTGGRDRYSWRGAEPAKLRALADKLSSVYSPTLIVAAAHGAIMPALLLAEYLELPKSRISIVRGLRARIKIVNIL